MFKNLPQVKQGNVEAFIDSEDFLLVIEKLNSYIDQLREKNEHLARTIEASAQTAVEIDFLDGTPEVKELLLANTIVAILIVLEVIDREFGNVELKKLLYG